MFEGFYLFVLEWKFASNSFIWSQLTDKQYEWTVLSARAKLKQWKGLEQMFQSKVCCGWVGIREL